MRKKIFIVLLLVLSTRTLFAQKQNQLRMVELPDRIKSDLSKYLKEKEKLPTEEGNIYVFNLQNPKDVKYKDGIYTFRLMGPHYRRRIFVVIGSEIKIFDSQFIDDLLQEFNFFIKQSNLSVKKKITYLKGIAKFLEEEYKIETS